VRGPEQSERSKVVLSKRETAIVQLLSHGMKNREIADDLGISIATVRTHVQHAERKLNARNRGHAIAEAMRLGLLI
jgi:DNA-binding CsgD family transcriptional regulator